jgi:peptidoglycan hydrolase-like protein with peptidoglycan-binding domain
MKKYIIFVLLLSFLFSNVAFAASLSRGSKGDSVLNLQKYLVTKGLLQGNPDGVFGRKTLNAVKEFQKLQGIKQDGVVGVKSLEFINNDISKNNFTLPPVNIPVIGVNPATSSIKNSSNLNSINTPIMGLNITSTGSSLGSTDSVSALNSKAIVAPKGLLDFKNWTLAGGATVDKDGVLHFSAYGQNATSPFIPVPSRTLNYGFTAIPSAEFYAKSISPHSPFKIQNKTALLSGSSYFDKNYQPTQNWGKYFGNGSTFTGEVNTWSSGNLYGYVGGPEITYIKVSIESNSEYTAPSYDVRNFSMNFEPISPFCGSTANLDKNNALSTVPTENLCSITYSSVLADNSSNRTYSVPASSNVNLDKANSVYTWSCGVNICKAPAKSDAKTTIDGATTIKNITTQNYNGVNYFIISGNFSSKDNVVLINTKENKPSYESSSQINVLVPADTAQYNISVVVLNTKTNIKSNSYTVTSLSETTKKVDNTNKKPVITGAQGYDPSLTPSNTTYISPNKFLVIYGNFADKDNTLIFNGVPYKGSQLAYESNSQINFKLGDLSRVVSSTATISVQNSNGISNVYSIGIFLTVNGLPITVNSYATGAGTANPVASDLRNGSIVPTPSTPAPAACGTYPSNLCLSGTASSANLDTISKKYVWSCGNGTTTGLLSCSAPYVGAVNGVCGRATNTEAPYSLIGAADADFMCYTGTSSSLTQKSDGTFSWYCNGSPASAGVNAGSSVICANRTASGVSSDIPTTLVAPAAPVATNGVCGGASYVWSPQEPTNNFCSAGTASRTTKNSDGTFSWTCAGVGAGAQTASCQNIYSGR